MLVGITQVPFSKDTQTLKIEIHAGVMALPLITLCQDASGAPCGSHMFQCSPYQGAATGEEQTSCSYGGDYASVYFIACS